jgi:hypothetical protein
MPGRSAEGYPLRLRAIALALRLRLRAIALALRLRLRAIALRVRSESADEEARYFSVIFRTTPPARSFAPSGSVK